MSNQGRHWTEQRANAPSRIAAVAHEVWGRTNPALARELAGLAYRTIQEDAPPPKPAQLPRRQCARVRFAWGGWLDAECREGVILTPHGRYIVRAGSHSAKRIERALVGGER